MQIYSTRQTHSYSQKLETSVTGPVVLYCQTLGKCRHLCPDCCPSLASRNKQSSPGGYGKAVRCATQFSAIYQCCKSNYGFTAGKSANGPAVAYS